MNRLLYRVLSETGTLYNDQQILLVSVHTAPNCRRVYKIRSLPAPRSRSRAPHPVPRPPTGDGGWAGRDGGEDEEAEAGLGSGSGVALRGHPGLPAARLPLRRRPAGWPERKTSPSARTRLRLSLKPLRLPLSLNVPRGWGGRGRLPGPDSRSSEPAVDSGVPAPVVFKNH
jgi:hypothetical protein